MKTVLRDEEGHITHSYSHTVNGKNYFLTKKAQDNVNAYPIDKGFINDNPTLIENVINGETPREHAKMLSAVQVGLISQNDIITKAL